MQEQIRTFSSRLYENDQRFAASRIAIILLAAWSFSEALIWFVLPDFLLLPLSILAPARWRLWLMVALVCSLLGTIAMIFLVGHLPDFMFHLLTRLPFTHAAMFSRIETLADAYGPWSTLWQPVSGIPVKAWTWMAVSKLHWRPALYLALVLLARGLRMAIVCWLGAQIARRFPQPLRNAWPLWFLLYSAFFFAFLGLTSR